ncbi:MAG: exonuclease domain-containing protein [bacterium]
MTDIIKDEDFIRLEKEFAFLSRARSRLGELEGLSYVIVDLETTGLNPAADEIIEIGAIKIEGKEIKDVFNKLVRPEKRVPENIVDLTGITEDMLTNELPVKPVISQFVNFIGNSILVAHNAEFDASFLKINLKKWLSKDMENLVVCTMLISRDILPNLENHKLPTIARYFGLDIANRHRAIGDAELTYQIWLKFMEKLKDKKVITRKDLETYLSNVNRPKFEQAATF